MSSEDFGKHAAKSFAWNHLYRIVDYGIWNLFMVMVTRTLGPEAAAPFLVYLSVALPLALFGTVGVDGVLLRYIARVQKDGAEFTPSDLTSLPLRRFIARLFSFRILITLLLVILVASIFIILPLLIPSVGLSLGSLVTLAPFLILFVIGQAATSFATFALIGLLQVRKVFYASLISRLSLLVAGLVLLMRGAITVESAVLVHTISVLLGAGLLLFWLSRGVEHSTRVILDPLTREQLPSGSIWAELTGFIRRPSTLKVFLFTPVMLYGITTWGSDILSTVLGRQPDIWMMRVFFGEHSTEIGYYQVATFALLMTEYLFLFGLSGALVSVFSSLAHRDEKEAHGQPVDYSSLRHARREVAAFQTVATLPICAFTIFFAPKLIEIAFGPKFLPAVPILQWGVVILAINQAFVGGGIQITSLVTIGKERLVFRYRLLWGLANLVANYFLIRHFGAIGALFGTQLANMFACLVESYFAARLIGPSLDLKNAIVVLFISSASGTTAYFAVSALDSGMILLWQNLIGVTLTLGLTLLCYYYFKVAAARRIFQKIRRTFMPLIGEDLTAA